MLIDCMPSLGMITINALAAADSVVIPTQPHYLSAKGLELLLRSVSMEVLLQFVLKHFMGLPGLCPRFLRAENLRTVWND